MSQANKVCGYDRVTGRPRLPGGVACGTTATHEVTYGDAGVPIPACPVHRREASLDVTRSVGIRRLRLR